MPRKERVILDPEEVALEGRDELDVHKGAIEIGEEGPDWGDYEINAFLAKRDMGEVPVDEEIPNRTIVLPLNLGASGDFDAARVAVEAWAAKVNHQGGGHLKREIIGGSYGEAGKKLFADCIKATLHLGGGSAQARDGVDQEAVLTIEALPDFYGERITEAEMEATGGGTSTHKIKGTLPARGELLVTDKSAKDQMGVSWNVRGLNYSSASTASWRYEAEALKALDAAAEVTLTGASGGKAIRHNNLGTSWTPVLGLQTKAGTYLTHVGLYDVWARVWTTSSEKPWLRLLHDTGDIVAPAVNPQLQVPEKNAFYEVYLGQVNLEATPYGTHRWAGVIQARGAVGGENVSIDQVEFRCADEASGVIRGRSAVFEPFAASYSVRDEFNSLFTGNATGATPAIGGTYQAMPNGDTTDFQIDGEVDRLVRTAVSDSGTISVQPLYPSGVHRGRGIGTSAKFTKVAARADFRLEGSSLYGATIGWMVSYVNDLNYMSALLSCGVSGWYLSIFRADQNGEGYSRPLKVQWPDEGTVAGTMAVVVRGNRITFFLASEGEELREEATIENAMIGVSGQTFLFDENATANAVTRSFDNLAIWVPQTDAAIFASRDLRIGHQGVYRKSEDGAAYGPVAHPGNDLMRLPVSGPEERLVEVSVRTSRGDFDAIPDSGLDLFKYQLSYLPCWSQVPGF